MEQGVTSPFLPLVDLDQVECENRANKWKSAVRDSFPSLSVRLPGGSPATGSISRVSMGSGDFFEIDSAPADVVHTASSAKPANSHISLMVQSKGAILVRQAGRSALLGKGDACVIDEARSFRLIGEGCSKIHFLRIPRAAALSRYPPLEKLFVTTFSCDDPGTKMLAETMLRFSAVAGTLTDTQRNAMTNAIIQMLGMAEPFISQEAAPDWRVRRALDFIELNLSVAGLTAEAVAQDQRISRRRLDQLMLQSFGHSIASHLWSRRLEQAAVDLRDPSRAGQSIAQIAFANGFEDAAHFTRAFKRRFSQTPRQWRAD
ncbi:helix-turn-helix domain-containing protein [Aurantiacibacter poecillastricola]|uniref:helix-turn-helix domain-containing protein n=1 Tax=Aurantiacibacter poecillastricola TaxID=3064385 RepID=UPI002740304C|nr:helix-turn-helix domain-containing protein [Aurantiacibacter sp. 219JJ12-13]MDP5262918.1 helix-turn-helix domain-containing protein [Aurantiacibacter sp. 219JJ12-13]